MMNDRRVWTVLATLLVGSAVAAGTDGGVDGMPPYAAPPDAPTSTPTLAVAQRVVPAPGTLTPAARVTGLLVGEEWACAALDDGGDWQCWEPSPHPRVWKAPGFAGKSLQAGTDRVCAMDRATLTFRCWQRPRRGDAHPRELPPSDEWLNPHQAGWTDSYSRGDRIGGGSVGGTFACLQTTKDEGVFCLGDDHYGQLGGSTPPLPEAGRNDRAFVPDLWPAMALAVGTWHACALAARHGMGRGGHVTCWGRDDYGHLGAPAPNLCAIDGRSVPCARRPVQGPATDGMAVLSLGDLFTCFSNRAGIQCWGANRDGFFGAPGSCPESLRRAWPTATGAVPAPKAACSATPVAIPGATQFDPHFHASPRGVCFSDGAARRCEGAIPLPADPNVTGMQMSPGRDANACGFRNGGVVCWGEGYASAGAPLDRPLAIPLATPPRTPIVESAVLGTQDSPRFGPNCLIHRVCPGPPRTLSPCPADPAARSAAELVAAGATLSGRIVHARGPLGVGMREQTLVGCAGRCCNHSSAPIVLGAGPSKWVRLPELACSGDESRACCNAPAYGQTVIVTGRLESDPGGYDRNASGFKLVDTTVCEDRNPR